MAAAFPLLDVQIADGIAHLSINRPQAMNALNPAVVFQLHQAFCQAVAAEEVRGVVIGGIGKAFVAGADVGFFLRNLASGDVDRIVSFTAAGHTLLEEIDLAAKPVVACIHGLALGGGLELALACDRILVSPSATLGLPETALGLYPGLGGTQRLPRKIGMGLAKWLIYTGKILSATEARGCGLADDLVAEKDLQEAAREAILSDRPSPRRPERSAELLSLEAFFQSYSVADLLAERADTQGNPRLIGALRRVRANAPVALRLAEWLIDEGMKRPPAEAMRLVLDRLPELFATRDAREGLSAVGKRQPVFQGC
jgi:enoyl-CoA hydratase/3-hydroxyacyl-CoA dehydrogenase